MNYANSLKRVQARCRRAGYDFDLTSDEVISLYKLDQAFKASGTDVEERLALKSTMALLGLIA